MKNNNKFIPYDVYTSIYDIDYSKLYSENVKIILYDLDNTIQKNTDDKPSKEAIKLIDDLKNMGFTVYILSNNSKERIEKYLKYLNILGFYKTKKPLKKGYIKVIKMLKEQKLIDDVSQIVAIGDQILTDVWGANKVGIKSILVKPIELSTEKWYTKSNRNIEKMIINSFKKKHKDTYIKIKNILGENND